MAAESKAGFNLSTGLHILGACLSAIIDPLWDLLNPQADIKEANMVCNQTEMKMRQLGAMGQLG
jgi:hypothetical protein